ncbi:MAG: PTS sugar transporter subunit IIA [Parvularcula sp.]|jgi:PTS system nitrogen regulatory IIA component|nr:PTS sugar transporter subunit IIA [Parvularcula sp.]
MTRTLRGFLAPEDVHLDVAASCKRSVLERLSELVAAKYGCPAGDVLTRLLQREGLGSTGVGEGVAIPHTRLDIDRLSGMLLRLKKPVSFDAVDGAPVDVVFLLLAPESDSAGHLKALSRVARTFRQHGVLDAVRGAADADAAFAAVVAESDAEAA